VHSFIITVVSSPAGYVARPP